MADLIPLLERFGYLFLFGLGFVEFAGLPIVTVPVLVAAGSLSASGYLDPVGVIVAVAGGGLLADAGWFALVRLQGRRLLDVACGLSTNPKACVLGVRDQVSKVGGRYVLVAKFIPGAGNLIAPASGLAGMKTLRFLVLDAVALLAWTTAYTVLGILMVEQVEAVLRWMERYLRPLVAAGSLLILGAGAWRMVKIRLHRRAHRRSEEEGMPAEASAPSPTS